MWSHHPRGRAKLMEPDSLPKVEAFVDDRFAADWDMICWIDINRPFQALHCCHLEQASKASSWISFLWMWVVNSCSFTWKKRMVESWFLAFKHLPAYDVIPICIIFLILFWTSFRFISAELSNLQIVLWSAFSGIHSSPGSPIIAEDFSTILTKDVELAIILLFDLKTENYQSKWSQCESFEEAAYFNPTTNASELFYFVEQFSRILFQTLENLPIRAYHTGVFRYLGKICTFVCNLGTLMRRREEHNSDGCI